MKLSYREISMILAGLRALQEEIQGETPAQVGFDRIQLVDVQMGGALRASKEIDALCEKINFGGNDEKPAGQVKKFPSPGM